MKISVIIPIYNGSYTIEETINSILTQTHKDLEVIIVDDGSTDNSVNLIKNILDPRIKIFTNKSNSGSPAGPRNIGIKNSKGDYIAFCDQDDLWLSDKLKLNLEKLQACSDKESVGLVYSSSNLIDENGKVVGQNLVPFDCFLGQESAYKSLLSGNHITACSVLIPRTVVEEVGFFDEKLKGVDDYDYWLRIFQKYGILAISKPLCAWRQSAKSLSANKVKQYIETEKMFRKLGDKTEDIKYGHGKNMVRIILASLLEKDFVTAKTYLQNIKGYPLSFKTNIIVKITDLSLFMGYILIKLLKIFGKVSL